MTNSASVLLITGVYIVLCVSCVAMFKCILSFCQSLLLINFVNTYSHELSSSHSQLPSWWQLHSETAWKSSDKPNLAAHSLTHSVPTVWM